MPKRFHLEWPYVVSGTLALVGMALGLTGEFLMVGSLLLAASVSFFTGASTYQVMRAVANRRKRRARATETKTDRTAED